MKTFTIEHNGNWTANDLLKKYAEQNGIKRVFVKYGKQLLQIDGKLYEFDHIQKHK